MLDEIAGSKTDQTAQKQTDHHLKKIMDEEYFCC
jgi:hypothetical protein